VLTGKEEENEEVSKEGEQVECECKCDGCEVENVERVDRGSANTRNPSI
jgi:hypothetical protein